MIIEWLPASRRDRRHQIAWLGDHNPQAAVRAGLAIEKSLRRLLDFPNSGRPGRIPGTRELVVAGTQYIVIYRVEAVAVVILRLVHAKQDEPRP